MREDLERLKAQLAPMLALSRAALNDLAAGNGTDWKEAVGELQSQYQEIPVWILLYDDFDLLQTHKAVCETLRPHAARLAPHQFVLIYEVVIETIAYFTKISGNEAIFAAGKDGPMDVDWIPSDTLGTVFTSRDSRRTE